METFEENYKGKRYFAIGVAKKSPNGGIQAVVDICTEAKRKPTKAIAAHYIPKERLESGYTTILDIKEISENEAIDLYGMSA